VFLKEEPKMLRYRLINPHLLTALVVCCALSSGAMAADQTLLKIDINATTNITHSGWEGWVISGNGTNGVQSKSFSNGIYVGFVSPWYTSDSPIYVEGFTNTYWGDFAGDMAAIADVQYNKGDLQMTIKYLAPGSYTLKTYHNPRIFSPQLNNLMDVNDKVGDGPWTREVTDFDQQNWVPNNDIVLANPCTLNFVIPANSTDYVIRYNTSFKHKTLTDPNIPTDWYRNVGICGFELISHAIYTAYSPSPAPDTTIRYNTSYNLSWAAPDPYTPGDTMHYDVYYSTASADMGTPGALLASYTTATTLPCPTLTARTNYYWRVDTYAIKDGLEIKTVGATWHFDTNNQAPTLSLGPAQVTKQGRTVTLTATATDADGLGKPDPSVITYAWSDRNDDVNDPNYAGRFGTNPSPFPATTQSVSFILDPNDARMGQGRGYRFTCKASDGDKSTSVDISVTCYSRSLTNCEVIKKLGPGYTKSAGDLNDDCMTDLKDMSLYVAQWLACKAVNNVCP
jgi:hypothetical protein